LVSGANVKLDISIPDEEDLNLSTSTPKHSSSRSRYTGLAAAVVLLFSIIVPPFVGPTQLLVASRTPLSRLMVALNSSHFPDLITVLSLIGVLLLVVGLLIGLVFFGVRYRPRRARVGMTLSAVGLLVITATFFDYSGDVLSIVLHVVQVGVWPSLEFFGTGYLLAWAAIIVGLMATRQLAVESRPSRPASVVRAQQSQVLERVLPTGYRALDEMLYGGLPVGSSIVLTGPPCDEKNIILRRFIETNLLSNRSCIFISTSLDRVQNLLSKYDRYLHVILCNPHAEIAAAAFPHVAKLKSLDSLTQLNLEYDNAVKMCVGKPAVLCLEVLDDVLLGHHYSTRRWLMDILGRSKTNQMTCLAALNPAMHPAEESQAVLETFDGHLDLYEAEIQVRPKLIRVRKLGRKFIDNELRVEKESI
jgi:KaiC/GvpD/RAD55 family RecA-like ATPase